MDKNIKQLILEVSAGIIIFAAAAMAAALFVYPKRSVFAGILLGMVLSLAMFFSMALVLEGAVRSGNPKSIQRRSILGAALRYVLLFSILAVVVLYFSSRFNPAAVLIGVFGFKAGPLLQPIIHKAAARWKKED